MYISRENKSLFFDIWYRIDIQTLEGAYNSAWHNIKFGSGQASEQYVVVNAGTVEATINTNTNVCVFSVRFNSGEVDVAEERGINTLCQTLYPGMDILPLPVNNSSFNEIHDTLIRLNPQFEIDINIFNEAVNYCANSRFKEVHVSPGNTYDPVVQEDIGHQFDIIRENLHIEEGQYILK
jgi:hypothetical protein